MLLAVNLVFIGGGVLLYWLARRRLLRGQVGRRSLELAASGLVCALVVGAFALAQVGMTYSWTGRLEISDLRWLGFASAFAGALLAAHLLLRLQRSRVDQLLVPVAAFLIGLGLINIYVWETRDANAYISTAALPEVRNYRASLAADGALSPDEKAARLRVIGSIPNELDYEREHRGELATVLNADWLESYNAVARRVGGTLVPVHEVRLNEALRRQLLAACLSLLLIPSLLLVMTRVRALAPLRGRSPLIALAFGLLAVAGGALATSNDDDELPALLSFAGQRVTVYELLKVGLVVLLAFALARAASGLERAARGRVAFAFAAAGATIASIAWLDTGAGIALLAISVLMVALVVGRRWLYALLAAAAVVLGGVPAALHAFESSFPETARVRLEMWSDPWGSYHRAQVRDQVARSLERIVARRVQRADTAPISHEKGERSLALLVRSDLSGRGSARSVAQLVGTDIFHVEQEFRWRLEGLESAGPARRQPFIPGRDPVDELVLIEAERLWSGLGGYSWAARSDRSLRAFARTIDDATEGLRSGARRLEAALLAAGGVEGASGSAAPPGSRRLDAAEPDNFQLQRSLFALRAGGLLGVGLGRGKPEALPGLTEDAAFVGLGEALGLAGIALIALLLLLIIGRGVEWGQRQARPVSALLMIGLSCLFGVQAVIALGGIAGVLPFTGLTFPFISRGGTSLVANATALALMLALSARPAPAATGRPSRGPRAWPRAVLRGAGFPAAFALLLAVLALLHLTGRTLTPGPVLAKLPGAEAPFLHARDQWETPSYRVASGAIVDRRGRVLARTTSLGGGRVYADKEVAASLAQTLMQLDISFRRKLVEPSRSHASGSGRAPLGPTLVTTLDADVQRAVHRAFDQGSSDAGVTDLSRLRGAVVVLDAATGDILALESRPSFSLAELSDARAWARAETRDRRTGFPYRYLNRAVHGLYPPGSIFKTVTAAAALELGLHNLQARDFDYSSGSKGPRAPDGLFHLGRWHELPLVDGPSITDDNHPRHDDWRFSLAQAYALSCNVAFAEMGLEVGAAGLVRTARRFGLERWLEVSGLGGARGTLDNEAGKNVADRFLAQTASNLARTAFGQAQVRVTPLQMALVAAGIANERGRVMQPRVVAGWKSSDGAWLEKAEPRVFSATRLSRQTLADLRELMWSSVTNGWAGNARLNPDNANPGVAGKTGSAEWSQKRDAPHAWFIGYFPAESPRVAIAVLVERGGMGPTIASRIGHYVFATQPLQRYVREATGR